MKRRIINQGNKSKLPKTKGINSIKKKDFNNEPKYFSGIQWYEKYLSSLKIIVPLVIAVYIWSLVFHGTDQLVFNIRDSGNKINKRTLLIFLSILCLLFSFSSLFRLNMLNRIKNIFLFMYSMFVFFLIFEMVFSYLPISQGNGQAYCANIWFNKYWKFNEYGYRDEPYDAKKDSLSEKIVMLGDSYVAGQGIKDVNQRMSNILGKKLGDKYRVFNLGQNGANTRMEFNNLQQFPYDYDKLILVHVPNDLDYIAADNEMNKKDISKDKIIPVEQKPDIFCRMGAFLVRESFFINFLSYTTIGGIIQSIYFSIKKEETIQNIKNINPSEFSDTAQLNQQLINLVWFDSVSRSKNIKMMILSFPYLGQNDKIFNKNYDNFINGLIRCKLDFMDARPVCNNIKLRQQVVSTLDKHPSVIINQIIADSLFNKLKRNGWF